MTISDALAGLTITKITHIVTSITKKQEINGSSSRFSHGLFFVVNGKFDLKFKGETYHLKEGDGFLLIKGMSYEIIRHPKSYGAAINFLSKEELPIDEIPFFKFKSEELLPDLERARDIHKREDEFYSARIYSLVYSIFDRLISTDNNDEVYLKFKEYIIKNISSPDMTVSEIAKYMGFSEVHFRRLFHSRFGMSPSEYITDLKINIASNMLSSTSLSIGKIAEKCGFSYSYYFTKVFKSKKGITPSQYRYQTNKFI